MLPDQRTAYLEKVQWSSSRAVNHTALASVECWKYDNQVVAQEDENFRVLPLADGSNQQKHHEQEDTRNDLLRWLHWKHPCQPPPAPGGGKIQGGIRLLVCEKANMRPGMTMSRAALEAVEKSFQLHPATIPSLFCISGATHMSIEKGPETGEMQRCWIVIKASQKVEIGNYLLSLSYDVSTGWTHAFLCGDGVIQDRGCDYYYGSPSRQLLRAIHESQRLWTNPLFLPCVVLENYTTRMETRATLTDYKMAGIEEDLGMTEAGLARLRLDHEQWPQNVNPKTITLELHSLLPQIIFMLNCCRWTKDLTQFMLRLEEQFRNETAVHNHHAGFVEIQEFVLHNQSRISSLEAFFGVLKERANLQANLLFNVISQQDSILNRRDSLLNHRIARSSKQDSISMNTFTFITAFFIPASFIAQLFSMSMFDWMPDGGDYSSSGTPTYVSSRFWIFWVTAVPLTVLTMVCWRLWSNYANAIWNRKLDEDRITAVSSINLYPPSRDKTKDSSWSRIMKAISTEKDHQPPSARNSVRKSSKRG